ncbi:hypothetical protein GOD54_23450 [Sinorhizobium medicae]|nr:hypothetical protein [Sinorhizobium medicae]
MSKNSTYTRQDYEDVEGFAVVAMAGIAASGKVYAHDELASQSFDMAEAMLAEKKNRLGKKPPYTHGDD